jgi:RNase P/RNase MRP subunit p30
MQADDIDIMNRRAAHLRQLRKLLKPTQLRRVRVVATNKPRWPFEVRATAEKHGYLLAIGETAEDALERAVEWARREVPRAA